LPTILADQNGGPTTSPPQVLRTILAGQNGGTTASLPRHKIATGPHHGISSHTNIDFSFKRATAG
jgi:hypothetical protein